MVPQLVQRHGSISINIQRIEIATDPRDAFGFLSIQAPIEVAVKLNKERLFCWDYRLKSLTLWESFLEA